MCWYHLTVCEACVTLERFTGKTIISRFVFTIEIEMAVVIKHQSN